MSTTQISRSPKWNGNLNLLQDKQIARGARANIPSISILTPSESKKAGVKLLASFSKKSMEL
jgi:hypothetical protein